jgi:acyl-CoA thioester hydrolase
MKLELPQEKKLVHVERMPIRWGDMDAMGHVNNTLYFRYLEIARIAWFEKIGCAPNPQGEGPLIVNAFCNFHKQLEYPGEIVVTMYASAPGRSSFESWATIHRADDAATVYASGGATTVWVDFPKQKSVAMPEWFRAFLT